MKFSKNFKEILVFALSTMLVLGSATTNAATNKNEGTVLPDPTKKGSITIHKYAMDQMPNPGMPATGLEGDAQLPEGATPLEGVSFKIEKVSNDTLPEQIVGDDTSNVVRDDSFKAQTITTADGENGTIKGVASINNLPQGIYLVTEIKNSGILENTQPFLVSIPMAHPTIANSWLYDVHVYPKNVVAGAPSIDKDIMTEDNKHDSADIGENVTWIIKPSIPADIADATKYDIIDELDSKLNYTGNLKVYYLEKIEGQEKPNEETIPKEWYSVSQPMVLIGGEKLNVSGPTNNQVLAISFNETGREELAKLYKEKNINSIRISFTTVINDSAVLGEEIPNNVTLNYTNSFGTNTEYHPSTLPEVHTGGVLLEKVDASDKNKKLEGAKFKIYPTIDDAKAGTNAILNPVTGEEYEVTTDEQGRAIFAGLSYGTIGEGVTEGSTDYWIVETVAPRYDSNGDGVITEVDKQYNLLRKPLKVTVNATSHSESNKVVVENRKFTLPVTGGVGTFIFTLGGLTLMGAAAYLYIRTTRKSS